MAIRLPVSDLGHNNDRYWLLSKTLHGLWCSPEHCHRYEMFTNILKDTNLKPHPHNPRLFSGIVNADDTKSTRQETHVGAYVDGFVFYSTDPAEEEQIKEVLESKLKVGFMGDADFPLAPLSPSCTTTMIMSPSTSLNQYLLNLQQTDSVSEKMNRVPNMIPYRSGLPNDSLPPPRAGDPDLKR